MPGQSVPSRMPASRSEAVLVMSLLRVMDGQVFERAALAGDTGSSCTTPPALRFLIP